MALRIVFSILISLFALQANGYTPIYESDSPSVAVPMIDSNFHQPTVHGVVLGNGAGLLSWTAPGTSGLFLQSQGSSADPIWAAGVTGATGATGATGSTGATGATGPNNITTSTTTNLSGYIKGSGSVIFAESAIDLTSSSDVNGVLQIEHGGTGQSAFTTHGVILGNFTSALASTSAGATHTLLHGNTGNDPTFSAVDLTSADVSGALGVTNGGTGAATLTVHGVVIGNGSSAVSVTSSGTTGQVLTSNGSSDPSFQAAPNSGQWIYGSGNDGTVYFDGVTTPVAGATLSGSTYTLTRDIAGQNITVAATVTVKTANYRIYGTGTFLDSGVVQNNGNSASGTTAGAATVSGTLSATRAGATGRTTNGNGVAASASSPADGGAGGTGGAAGSGGFTSAAGGTVTSAATNGSPYAGFTPVSGGISGGGAVTVKFGGGGGSAGALNISAGSPTGGAGGAGAGIIIIAAHIINVVSGASITADGGVGSAAVIAGGTGDAGGGGGGGGGVVDLISDSYTNNGTVRANGGAGGAAIGLGSAGGTGVNGSVITIANSVSPGYTGTSVNLGTQVTGIIPLTNGGTNANLSASNGGVFYSTATQGAITAAGTTGQLLMSNGASAPTWRSPNITQALPSNPTQTLSAAGVMMGLAGAITPTSTGNVVFIVTGIINSGATGNPTCQLRYGTGTAPTNGAANTGTPVGTVAKEAGIATGSVPFTCTWYASSLTVNTAYWYDLSLVSDGTSNASVTSITMRAEEK